PRFRPAGDRRRRAGEYQLRVAAPRPAFAAECVLHRPAAELQVRRIAGASEPVADLLRPRPAAAQGGAVTLVRRAGTEQIETPCRVSAVVSVHSFTQTPPHFGEQTSEHKPPLS